MDIAEVVENVLEHHGVLGMKWGRRSGSSGVQSIKDVRARSRSSKVTVSDKARKVKTSGGRGHPAHPEAIGKATTGQILSKSGAKALSNSQLKAYNERMNLEANARRLAVNDMSMGRKFVAVHIRKVATQQVSEVSSQVASQQVKKHLTSRLIKTAAVAAA